MRDAVSEEGRILSIFEKEGVIKLKPGIDKVTARISDIVENPKKLQFTPNVEASLLPQMYNNDEGAAVVINANYAIDAGLIRSTIQLRLKAVRITRTPTSLPFIAVMRRRRISSRW